MSEYIGLRLIRFALNDAVSYVGTLHEINSENSTVALEQVKSYGTEGRSEEEVPPSDNVYEYIVFRGSDVKDLRIEKEPEKKTQAPQVPDDPAILGNARPVGVPSAPSQPEQQMPQHPQYGPPQGRGQAPRYPQQLPYPYGGYGLPPSQRFGPGPGSGSAPGPGPGPGPYGAPQNYPPPGYSAMQYGPPPGWYPPHGQGFPQGPSGQMMPPHLQQHFPGQPPPQHGPASKPATPGREALNDAPQPPQPPAAIEKPAAAVKLPSRSPANSQIVPPPPTESKPDVAAALAPPSQSSVPEPVAPKSTPGTQKSGRIQPAIPMKSPIPKAKAAMNGTPSTHTGAGTAADSAPISLKAPSNALGPTPGKANDMPTAPPSRKVVEDANRDARAAVAAAMAKLGPGTGQQKKQSGEESAMDNLTKKVNEMRTNENARVSRQPGTGGYAAGNRGGRGGYRGGRPRTESQTKKIEMPKTDYDFESANAKFNKQDLVKEAIASGEPVGSPVDGTPSESVNGTQAESETSLNQSSNAGYNRASSFFDNISSEAKDREDGGSKRPGGREFRTEEQKKNMETFGQGSVDSYRGGFRGRGRGRGFRGGRGGFGRGRGARGRGGGAVAAEG
ncbi:uncharacterized protein KY384_000221 [Bacidia gigantensis]|uniref:uncharacterized protein n=1 Tax=Bacidia gigantensis TaxID=2732470 RepID=UPI001D03C8CF|nr:uncharacterized protein KY384_000221 [Bacidia gigantensis]KAG8526228.1 hypothetical protein KY384_000221 [Bacidia gigantensis]